MNESNQRPDNSDETFQLYPVQSFVCKAIPVTADMVLTPRLGRPNRNYSDLVQRHEKGGDVPAQPESPPTEPPAGKA